MLRHQAPFVTAALISLRAIVCCAAAPLPSLPQDAYVWQRAWGAPVREAVRDHGAAFNQLVALRAEIGFMAKQPQIENVAIDYAALMNLEKSVGLALRIGTYPGPFVASDPVTKTLTNRVASILAEARNRGVPVSELQLDFDCAESRLGGYAVWLGAIRKVTGHVSLVITALPSWLNRPEFKNLIAHTDGYVLQVHSIERPKGADAPLSLCDPAAASAAVKRASALGVPFRVALPTYGYLVAFGANGKFIGLSAEGPAPSWPDGTTIREVRSDPQVIAGLVQSWATNRPPNLTGIIWYRFPIADDILNWRWPTLSAMVSLRSPRESFRAESRRVEPGLVEISLVNDGELDISSRLAVEVRWSRGGGTRLLAADGLRGFEVAEQDVSVLRLKSKLCRLPAGERQVIGWLRLSNDREVQVECENL